MQIVIDIPECDYNSVKKYCSEDEIVPALYAYVANGIVLPKGHGRLISADSLKRKMQKVATEAWKMKIKVPVETVWNQAIDLIVEAPTVLEADKESEELCR